MYLSALGVWGDFQGRVLALCQIFGAVEQVLKPEPNALPHGLVSPLQLTPFLLFLLDDTVEEPKALPQS